MKLTILQDNDTETILTDVEFIFFSKKQNNTISLRTDDNKHINIERVDSFKWQN